MKLFLVRRKPYTDDYTSGKLYVNGEFECWTLEDKVREIQNVPVSAWKIKGKTAIPRGTYRIDIDWSNRFKKLMLHVLDVKGFDGIRIHIGNTDKDVEGCVLVGDDPGDDGFLGKSTPAYNRLFKKVKDAINAGTDVWLTIT